MPAARLLAGVSTVAVTTVTTVLALIGAAAGFKHTHDWAVTHGQTGWLAWADAVVIEGICLVAGFEIHRDRHTGRSSRLPLAVLVIGFGVQMTAQVAEAEPTPAGWLLAAVPALGFLIVVKLLIRRLPTTTTAPAPVEAPATAAQETAAQEVASPQPAPVVRDTVERSVVALPDPMAAQLADLVTQVRATGREPTADDIRTAIRVPAPMAARIAAGLAPA